MDREEGKPEDIVVPFNDEIKLPPKQESRWSKAGPVIFWASMMALPAMGLGASYFMYKTAQYELMTALVNNTPKELFDVQK